VNRTDRRLGISMLGLTLVGLADATYLTIVHYAKLKPVCALHGGCETVQQSVYSRLDGVPIALVGLIGYIAILAALVLGPRLVGAAYARLATVGFTLIGFGFSAYLTYREVFTIKAICQWCVGSAVIMTCLIVLALWRYLTSPVLVPDGATSATVPPEASRGPSERAAVTTGN
jgi:uncharacterized membrane protein